MCNECDKLQEAISHDRQFLTQRFDPLTESRRRLQISNAARPHYIGARWDWVESRSRSRFLIEHDLRANALRLLRGITATHFSGSCPDGV